MQSLKGWQRDAAFWLFYGTFLTRTISLLLGWPGTGKSYLAREFLEDCRIRQQRENERRRVIDFERGLEELSESGVFRNPPGGAQKAWLLERYGGKEEGRASRRELEHWGASYRSKAGAVPAPLEEKCLEGDEPATIPTPFLITPSMITSPTGLVRLVYQTLGRPRKISEHFTDEALHASLEELRQKRNILLLVDEAQRLEPKTLAVVREFHDDGEAPIVLIATPEIRATLARPQLASLLSRIAFEEHIGPISEEQLAQLHPDLPAGVRTALIRASGGNFRALVNLVRAGEHVREAQGDRSLTSAHLQEAAAMVPGIRWTIAPETAAASAARRPADSEATIRRKAARQVG